MSNLPPGCTDRMVDRHMGGNMGEEECEECGGTGHTGSECCCARVPEETGCCSKCGEHATNAECTECDGTGLVEFDIEERRREARDNAAIQRAEDRALWDD